MSISESAVSQACIEINEINGCRLEEAFLRIVDHIGIITLHSPPVNASTLRSQADLMQIYDHINHNDDIWVCVMHSDIKTFCAGFDIKLFQRSIESGNITNVQDSFYQSVNALYDLRVPVICAVHGHCLGGGLCYPASADVTIAAEGTVFGTPEAKLGVVGGSAHFARLLPPMLYRELCYTGRFITAEELHASGGVTMVVRKEDLMETAMAKAREFCKQGPLVLRHIKACLNLQEHYDIVYKTDLEMKYSRHMSRYKDFQERIDAFFNKREPVYQGDALKE